MTPEESSWVLQWRLEERHTDRHLGSSHARFITRWRNLRFAAAGTPLNFPPTIGGKPKISRRDWMYHANGIRQATQHTFEEAMRLYVMMANTYKRKPIYNRNKLWRLYNVQTKEEIYPSFLGIE